MPNKDYLSSAFILLFLFYASLAGAAKVLTPQQFGAIINDGIDDSHAIEMALASLEEGDTLLFSEGVYEISKEVAQGHLKSVTLKGEPGSLIKKREDHQGQYILAFRFSEDLTITGLTFEGVTTDQDNYYWGRHGVFLGSTRNSVVTGNTFRNIGDACLQVATSNWSKPGVHAYDTVIEENRFINCTQVSTTQPVDGYGGTENIKIRWNFFDGLKTSLKLCTRAPASGGLIENNLIINSKRHAIEICSYSNVTIRGNYIKNTSMYGVNYYDNGYNFPWDSHTITHNVIENSFSGIGFWAQMPGADYGAVKDVQVSNNCFSNIYGKEDVGIGVIRLTSNLKEVSFDGLSVINNQFYKIANPMNVFIHSAALDVIENNNSQVSRSCSPWSLRYLGKPWVWKRYHSRPLYKKLWLNAIERL